MRLYYFKGFESEYNSTKFKFISNKFKNLSPIEIVYPDIDKNIKLDFNKYKQILINQIKDEEVILVGSSFGGYWAAILANEVNSMSCININPAPTEFIKKYFDNPQEYNIPHIGCYTILGRHDGIFNYKNYVEKFNHKCSIDIDENGNHRDIDLDLLSKLIKDSINYGYNNRII